MIKKDKNTRTKKTSLNLQSIKSAKEDFLDVAINLFSSIDIKASSRADYFQRALLPVRIKSKS